MAVKFKAKGKITDDGIEVKVKIKGLESFFKNECGDVDLEKILNDLFENNPKQLKLPNNQGVMLIVSS